MTFLKWLEGMRTPLLDKFFQFVTYFGQELIIIAFICTLYWCVNKRFAYILGFTYFTAGLCVQSLKITFRIDRPWVLDPKFHAVESAMPAATGYSFPSGHTQGATCLYAPIALTAKRIPVRIVCVLAFVLVGFSRMYLGVHTPKDVLVSMGISLFFSWLMIRYAHILLDEKRCFRLTALVLSLVSVAVAAYALCFLSLGIIEYKYASDCLKASGAGIGFALGFFLERSFLNFDTGHPGVRNAIFRVLAGLLGALVLKSFLPYIIGESLYARMFEYFVLVLWILFIYPYLFIRVRTRRLSARGGKI